MYRLEFCPGECMVMTSSASDESTKEWAEKHVIVPEGPQAGAGYDASLSPYFPPLWDLLFEPWVQEMYLVAGPQIGKTLFGQTYLARRAVEAPGPRQVWLPDEDLADEWFDKKIIPLFQKSPRLRKALGKSRYAVEKTEISLENGSTILARWSGSKSKRASLSCRDGLGDEPDMFQAGAHKDFQERVRAYRHLSKILWIGKPIGTVDESWIWAQKSEADVRLHYEIRCPACGQFQKMKFEQIKVPEGERCPKRIRSQGLAWYECEHCQVRLTDRMRDTAVKRGRWVADKKVDRPGVVWVHLPSWHSHWVSLSRVMADWFLAQGDPEKIKSWWNGYAAQPYDEVITATDEDRLKTLMVPELPPLVVPDRALAVTVSVDMQKDHFIYSTAAHGFHPGEAPDREDWIIDQGRLPDFADLKELIFKTQYRQDGTDRHLGVWRSAVDTGGGKNKNEDESRTVQLYNWLLNQPPRRVVGTKGMSRRNPGVFVKFSTLQKFPDGKAMKKGLRLYFIDTTAFKDLLFWRLGEEGTEPIWFHNQTTNEYFKQIVSEKKQLVKGQYVWKAVRANHWLDTMVGHLAMTHFQWTPSFESRALALAKAQVEAATRAAAPRSGGSIVNPYTGEVVS